MKIEKVTAYKVGDDTFMSLSDAEKAVRIGILIDAGLDSIDAEMIAQNWAMIEGRVKEAMRGL